MHDRIGSKAKAPASHVGTQPLPPSQRLDPRAPRRRRVRRIGSAGLACGVLLFHPLPAAANGRFPAANQIVFSPSNPDLVVLRTSYGILPSHDNGATWQYLCEEAIGVSAAAPADPPIGLTENDSLLAGVSLGMNVSPDVGCNWNCVAPLAGQTIVDLAVRPDAPSSAVAITASPYLQPDSGQELESSQVFETNDNGVHWAPLGILLNPNVIVTTLDVSKTDPNRIYVSGVRGYGAQRTASLFVSTDKGASWSERPLPAGQYDATTEDSIFIGAVDPSNADRVYIRSSARVTGGRSRLTVVTGAADAAPTFSTAHIFDVDTGNMFSGLTGEMLGFALSPDGSKVYIGSREDGLWVALASDLAFQKTSSVGIQCLATRGSELWACAAAVDGFIAGVSTDDGRTFASKLPLIGALAGPIACSPNASGFACDQDANASQCGPYYQTFCEQDTCGPATPQSADASDPDASSTRGPISTATSPSSSCDLALVGPEGAAGVGAVFALFGLALQRRRQRR